MWLFFTQKNQYFKLCRCSPWEDQMKQGQMRIPKPPWNHPALPWNTPVYLHPQASRLSRIPLVKTRGKRTTAHADYGDLQSMPLNKWLWNKSENIDLTCRRDGLVNFFGWLVVWMSSQLVGQLVGRFGWLINCLLFVVCSSVWLDCWLSYMVFLQKLAVANCAD